MGTVITNLDLVLTADGTRTDCDIVCHDGVITAISPAGTSPPAPGDTVVSGRSHAAVAGLVNGHTHAAMTLLRGYGDDMRLQPWLETRIWPAEAKLTEDDVYWGTRLAILEMIRGGTLFANDMYFRPAAVRRAFEDGGIRGAVGLALFDFDNAERREAAQAMVTEQLTTFSAESAARPRRVFPTIAPHSIYTCSSELLAWSAEVAKAHDLVYHIHMSETVLETQQSRERYGITPWVHLDSLGVLDAVGRRLLAAHTIWLDHDELARMARAGATAIHNPVSNMKLASGAMDYRRLAAAGVGMLIGPDGVASNNALDMWEETKIAALLAKHASGDPTTMPASEALAIAVGARTTAFDRWGVGGHLREGGPADIVLVDLDHPRMVPMHSLESNLVYAGGSDVISTVICDGKVLMADRDIPGATEVIREARRCAADLVRRARG